MNEEFKEKIGKMVWKKILDVAKNSNCEKRKVGCIIVNEYGELIAGGYNWHENGSCDCATTKSAVHAEIMAVNNIPIEKREENLYAYITHKPCERCASILNKICQAVEWGDLSPVLPGWKVSEDILEERKHTHGDFRESSRFVQYVENLSRNTPNWEELHPNQKEALHMIQHKIARILYGDPDLADTWTDIAGYARLIEEELNDKK